MMETEFEGVSKQLEEGTKTKVRWIDKLKTRMFQACSRYRCSSKKTKVRNGPKVNLQLLFIPVQTLQLVSIAVESLAKVTDYRTYAFISEVLEGVRFDLWTKDNDTEVVTLIVTAPLLIATILAFFLQLLLLPSRPRLFDRLLSFISPLSYFSQRFLFLPLLLFYLRLSVGCWISALHCLSLPLELFSLLAAMLCVAIALVRTYFVYESAWFLRSSQLLAQPHCAFELKEVFCLSLVCAAVTVFTAEIALLVLCAVSGYLVIQLFLFLPYFNQTTLLVKSLQYSLCLWISFCGLLSIMIDSMETEVVLGLFVSPGVCVLAGSMLLRRINSVRFQRTTQNFRCFEQSVRAEFERWETDPLYEDSIKDMLKFGGKLFADVKQYYLMLSHYYFYVRDLAEVALLRLSAASHCQNDYLVDFQVFHFCESVCKLSKSDERDFVDYQSMFQIAKTLDRELCESTYDLFNRIINKNASPKHLQFLFVKLAGEIKQAKGAYGQLKAKFPSDPFLLESLGSFLRDLFYDSSADELIARGYFERNRRKKANINSIESYNSEDTGVLIISCHHFSYGKIIFANEQMARVLDSKVSEIVGRDLDDFIPPPYNWHHNEKLTRFLKNGEDKEVFRSHMFLSANQKYTVEVTFRFRPTSVQNVPYFVVAVRPKPRTRQFALLNSDFVITSHSQNFPLVAGCLEMSVTGIYIEKLLPDVRKFYTDAEQSPFVYVHPVSERTFGMMFSEVEFGSSKIHWLYVFTQEKGIEDLFSPANWEALSGFRRILRGLGPPKLEETASEYKIPIYTSQEHTPGTELLKKDTKEESSCGGTMASFAYSWTGGKIRKKMLRAAKTFKLTYIAAVLAMSVLLSVSLAVMFTSLANVSQANNAAELGACPMHFLQVARMARRLQLMEKGYEANAVENEIVENLKKEIATLGAIADKYLEEQHSKVPVWQFISQTYSLSESPLITALKDFTTFAQIIASTPSPAITPSFFYVFSNGFGPLLHSLNETVSTQVSVRLQAGFRAVEISSIATLILMGVALVVACLLLGKSLRYLQNCYKKLWKVVLSLNVQQMRNIMTIHKDRIELFHGTELCIPEQTRVKTAQLMSPPGSGVFVLVEMLIFVSMSVAFLSGMLVYETGAVAKLKHEHDVHLSSVWKTIALPVYAMMLIREDFMSTNTSEGYRQIIGEGQLLFSLHQSLREAGKTIIDFESQTLNNQQDFSNIASSLGNACPFLNTSVACGDTALAKGQHAAVIDFSMLLSDLVGRSGVTYQALTELEGYIDSLVASIDVTLKGTQAYVNDETTTFTLYMTLFSGSYVFLAGLLYFLLYLPMISRLKKRCLSLWSVSTLVRNDFVAKGMNR